jgi:hypothetical protein|tara:strand:+ start:440 stop:655 length:216 start_codon:yes stop_codon:yes gene_type:complete
MKLEEGQLIKFSYMGPATEAMLGIVTKVTSDKINIIWMDTRPQGSHTHVLSFEDFAHAIGSGVYEIVEENT